MPYGDYMNYDPFPQFGEMMDQRGGYTQLPALNPMLGAPLPPVPPAPPQGAMERFRNWMIRPTTGTYEADIPDADRLENLKRAVLLGAMKSSSEATGSRKGLAGAIQGLSSAGLNANQFYNNLLQNDIQQRIMKDQMGMRERVTRSGEQHADAATLSAQASMINAMKKGEPPGAPARDTFWSPNAKGKLQYQRHQWLPGYQGELGGVPNWIPLGGENVPGSGSGNTLDDKQLKYYSDSVKKAQAAIYDFQKNSLRAYESIFNLPQGDSRKITAEQLLQRYANAKRVFKTVRPDLYAKTEWAEEDAQADILRGQQSQLNQSQMPPGAIDIGRGRLSAK